MIFGRFIKHAANEEVNIEEKEDGRGVGEHSNNDGLWETLPCSTGTLGEGLTVLKVGSRIQHRGFRVRLFGTWPGETEPLMAIKSKPSGQILF